MMFSNAWALNMYLWMSCPISLSVVSTLNLSQKAKKQSAWFLNLYCRHFFEMFFKLYVSYCILYSSGMLPANWNIMILYGDNRYYILTAKNSYNDY